MSPSSHHSSRRRARDLGITLGLYPPGRYNAITDVRGVLVGHCTLVGGEGDLVPGEGPIRTGVTAILPNRGDVFTDRVVGGGFILNGAGEVAGLTQVMEWGVIETPILLTNTLSVGAVSDAMVRHLVGRYPGIGQRQDVPIPVVGECDDSYLNDIAGRHIREEHVAAAVESATGGPVAEGSVGAGTGMITCDFKSGIGTSSRRLPPEQGGFTVGVLVQSNFGIREDLRVMGVPVGALLAPYYRGEAVRTHTAGSIITVVATDAPLLSQQLSRLARRAALGIGRVGSIAAHGSGEIVVAFSTANRVPRTSNRRTLQIRYLLDSRVDPLYRAVIEATEEAIINSLCMADDMVGAYGRRVPGLPLEQLQEIMDRYGMVVR